MKNDQKDSLIGTRIREYEILDVIGKGGMGAVYRARHIYLDEERAIKVIHAPLADQDSPFIDRFIREAKILTKLRHPDLVELYEFGRLDEKMFFMVMELMKGESVQERMKKLGRIPLADALRIIREAANGLHVAHQRGIVHRDISPDNLMLLKLDNGMEITKVIDFGIAKPTYQETHRYTIGEMFMGKPQFSSPEQCGFHEEGEEIDRRADIYSLAITLYYMLSAKLPFYSATPQGYLVKHASEPPKPISTHFAPGELPDEVEKLIAKALSKKRDQRQSSMAEFAEEIGRIQDLSTKAGTLIPTQVKTGEFHIGSLFARRYEIEKKIGRGGMGVVYQAIDKFLDIPVALKTMNPDIADDQRTLNRMKREVILARKISHPSVCRIYDIGESDGVHYVSMELLQGRSVADILLKDGAMPITEALSAIKQILDAVEAAHTAGVLHRDLKPQNILIDPNGRAHIMDFGISTSSDVSRLTQTGGLIGTPRYMAPEQFGGGEYYRADMYSIGIIMFEMLTGALPFEANTPATVMYAHLHSPPKKPSELNSGLPLALENIVLKALEKDPANRFQTITEFRNALEPFLKPAGSSVSSTQAHSAPAFTMLADSGEILTKGESAPPPVTDAPVIRTIPLEVPTQPSIKTPPEIPIDAPTDPSGRKSEPIVVGVTTQSSDVLEESRRVKKKLLIGGAAAASVLIVILIWALAGSGTKETKKEQIVEKPVVPQVIQQPLKTTPPPAQEVRAEAAPPPVEVKSEGPTTLTETRLDETTKIETPTTEPLKIETPVIETAAPVPGRTQYTVEVMATSWKNRAEEKISQLNQNGYSSFLGENTESSNKYRVRIGRFNNFAEAKETSLRLKKELQVEPWVVTLKSSSTETPVTESKPSVPAVVPAQPAALMDGTISFEGPFPVKVFNGKDLVMDTSVHKSQKLNPGKYQITLTFENKALVGSIRQTLEVKAGENTVIPAPAIGYLSIRANPSNCRITIDEGYQDAPPMIDLPILVGKHRIFVEWRSLEVEEEITIEILENKTTRLRAFVTGDSVGIAEE